MSRVLTSNVFRTMQSGIYDFLLRPRAAYTLACIRIATGAMIAYIHSVWLLDLEAFFGPHALLSNSVVNDMHAHVTKWTYLTYSDSLALAGGHEVIAAVAGILMCIGFATRWSVPIAWLTTLLTAHRLAPFLFGLDQVVLMLAMYLCLGSSGSVWSVDAWLASRWMSADPTPERDRLGSLWHWLIGDGSPAPRWNNTVATRLIQIHLSVIYLFGGLGKLRGWMWWDGSAMWFSAAAYEYQSLPLTWIGRFPTLGSMVTHATLFWEVGYVALVWSRWTRPFVLAMAIAVHGGIAIFLGMITFGIMMIVANFAFVDPEYLARRAS